MNREDKEHMEHLVSDLVRLEQEKKLLLEALNSMGERWNDNQLCFCQDSFRFREDFSRASDPNIHSPRCLLARANLALIHPSVAG